MKKIVFFVIAFLAITNVFAQKLITRNGIIKFEASMPALEEIAGTNNTVSGVIDKSTGDIAFLVLVKGFKFKVPLMEEHFNENYMESDKFPKATFKGKILNFNGAALSASKTYDVEGDLTIHGVTKKVKQKITVSQSGTTVTAKFFFSVKAQDYNISIPSVVKSKIAQDIKVEGDFNFTEK